MRGNIFITFTFLFTLATALGQDKDLDRLVESELKMTPPSIYFKHNSTEYTSMPYVVDSCFKYIAMHKSVINDMVIWRDTLESEKLTAQRIKKLKAELRRYKVADVRIKSMGDEQKISRGTINLCTDSAQIKYLLSLNSVFDISKTRLPVAKANSSGHIDHPRIWCVNCWRNHRFSKEYRRMNAARKQSKGTSEQAGKKRKRRHLVWTGWKHGFHWSDAGQK